MSETSRPFRVLAWGCGVQSTLLGELSARGIIEKVDLILSADPGWERAITYQMRDWYAARWEKMGMKVVIMPKDDIKGKGARDHIHIPFWTSTGGPLTRQCTRAFKIRPMRRWLRTHLGFPPDRPPHPPAGAIEQWMGITTDEWTRAKPSNVQYVIHRWPLLEQRMSRADCEQTFISLGLPVPIKSACVCCPYRRPTEWLDMIDTAPDEWADAVAFDQANRKNPLDSKADELFIYRGDQVPLDQADLDHDASRERRLGRVHMFACESGLCGV